MLVPALLDEAFPAKGQRASATLLNRALALLAAALLAVLLATTLVRPAAWFESRYPPGAADALARAAAADPQARIYADVAFADWLLWLHPELADRIAFDARFELLSRRQIAEIYNFNLPVGQPWRVPTRGYRLLVLDDAVSKIPIADFRREPGARVLYASSGPVVIAR
jgi:hypothetical protein